MKKAKIVVCVLIVAVICVSLSACYYSYTGEYRDLYTVAINNIFGAKGCRSDGEWVSNPTIYVIETDAYGRVMFFYDEFLDDEAYGTALVIMQQSDVDYVYYYQDDCYVPSFNLGREYRAGYRDLFSEEEIAALKELNDWNKELNLDKCIKSQIVREKASGTLDIKEKEFDEWLKPFVQTLGYNGDDSIFRYARYCNTDKYGRELYYVYGIGRDADGEGVSPTSKYQDFEFAMIFNPNKTCSMENIYLITEPSLTFDALKLLKETAGWNQPYFA